MNSLEEKLFGEEHTQTADSYHSLGVTQHQLGDYTSALQSHQHALCTCHRLPPGVGPPGQPGEYVGNTSRWIRFSAPGKGEIREIFSSSKESGGGIRNFVKSRTVTTGIYPFTQTIESKMMMTGQAKHVHGSYWSG